MLSYCTNQEYLADQKNLIKIKSLNYMKSEEKWDYLENILQIFARMQKQVKKAAIAVVVLAHAVEKERQMQI